MSRFSSRIAAVSLALLTTLAAAAAGAALARSTHRRAPARRHRSALSLRRLRAANGQARSRVIVLLRNQHTDLPPTTGLMQARTAAVRSSQAPVESAVRTSGGKVSHSYRTVDAFAATVSPTERSRLAADPAVAEVVPDATITIPAQGAGAKYSDRPMARSHAHADADAAVAPTGQQICPTDPSKPLLEPEALSLTDATQAQQLVTGAGVKVAFVAEGIDINNPDFIRPDGSHVFVDYRDFTGAGLGAPTGGGEAFGDASSIAAQGHVVYDLSQFVNPAHPLPPGCNIVLRGVSPGASLVGMDVFDVNGVGFTSTLLQGMDWAVSQDHVNVLNESFGSNPIPDTTEDVLKQFNDLATASGLTVTVSSGDSGTTNTIGSPANDPNVLDVGASTQFQGLAQTGRGGYPLSSGGWANDNIAEFSSGGFTDNGRTLDLVAPGNESYEACTASDTYGDCLNFAGNSSNLSSFGGTSESAPLTAGVAALVIQAYRQSHGGATPAPALVKQIITGSARDLDIPSDEQGAGELNALNAVKAAESVNGGSGSASGHLTSPSQLDLAVPAGSAADGSVRLTNSGSSAETYTATLRTLTTQLSDQKADVTLDPSTDPQFVSHLGVPQAYAEVHFTVPPGADRIDASLAHPGPDSTVNMTLLDPSGAFTAFTYHPADDFADFSHIDVRQPPAGMWTAVFSTPADGTGFRGAVHYDISTSRFGSVGSVSPSSVTLAPGASTSLHVSLPAPSTPGDSSRDLQISGDGQTSVVPVVVRSLVPLHGGRGTFSGAITGGNGDFTVGREDTFSFDVPRGAPTIGVGFSLPGDPNTEVDGYLVAPDGQTLARGVALSPGAETMQLVARNPEPGRWTLVLGTPNPVGGTTTSGPFTGTISLTGVPVSATGVPSGRRASIPEGGSRSATVGVTNATSTPLSVFIDPRLHQRRFYALTAINPPTVDLPLGLTPPPTWAVPTQTNLLLAAAHATAPITFEWGYGSLNEGDPDLESRGVGNNAADSFAARQVSPGEWFMAPSLVGPFATASSTAVATGLAARTRAFDDGVSSATGDPQLADVTAGAPAASPVTVAPGATVQIPITFTPSGRRGTVVRGDLFVDDNQTASESANELGAIPYSYRIAGPSYRGGHGRRRAQRRH
jgi:subtilisin family serine protease